MKEESAKVQRILFEIKYYIQGHSLVPPSNSEDSENKRGNFLLFSPQKGPRALVNGNLVDWQEETINSSEVKLIQTEQNKSLCEFSLS
jgi:hypothetical protein